MGEGYPMEATLMPNDAKLSKQTLNRMRAEINELKRMVEQMAGKPTASLSRTTRSQQLNLKVTPAFHARVVALARDEGISHRCLCQDANGHMRGKPDP
jgi:predicted HicB family RNase H-like nuclease